MVYTFHFLKNPTSIPSINPTIYPITVASINPTNLPTYLPIKEPSWSPTTVPSINPTTYPTKTATNEHQVEAETSQYYYHTVDEGKMSRQENSVMLYVLISVGIFIFVCWLL